MVVSVNGLYLGRKNKHGSPGNGTSKSCPAWKIQRGRVGSNLHWISYWWWYDNLTIQLLTMAHKIVKNIERPTIFPARTILRLHFSHDPSAGMTSWAHRSLHNTTCLVVQCAHFEKDVFVNGVRMTSHILWKINNVWNQQPATNRLSILGLLIGYRVALVQHPWWQSYDTLPSIALYLSCIVIFVHGIGESTVQKDRGSHGTIMYKWGLVHCHVWLPEGTW